MDYTQGKAPEIFRQWAGISLLSAAMERRCGVIVNPAKGPIYPNMLIWMVGPPGNGKTQALGPLQDLLKETDFLYQSPKEVTKAALLDAVNDAMKNIAISPTDMISYSSLYAVVPEFGNFVVQYDLTFLHVLNDLYDNEPHYSSRTRGGGVLNLVAPQLGMVAGTTPGFLMTLLPPEAWLQGTMSRTLLIFNAEKEPEILFQAPAALSGSTRAVLVEQLQSIYELQGLFQITAECQSAVFDWVQVQKLAPEPTHLNMTHYCSRRLLHVSKLAMVAAISRTGNLVIELEDWKRAQSWLFAAEDRMPEIFRALSAKNDGQFMTDLHMEAFRLSGPQHKPVPKSQLLTWLSHMTTADRAVRLLDFAIQSGMLQDMGGVVVPKATEGMR